MLLNDAQGIAGGFQLLWRQTRFGRIGYVSKGPVPRHDTPESWERLVPLLQQSALRLGLTAVIVQLPDFTRHPSSLFRQEGFEPNQLHSIIEATWLIDLDVGLPSIESEFHTLTRRTIRYTRRDGFIVRTGTFADVPIFFRMMRAMCERLGTCPNPATENELAALWNAFQQSGLMTMLVAVQGTETLGAVLLLRFGNRLTLWKQACDPSRTARRPDTLLYYEGIKLGTDTGCRWFDVGSFDSKTASSLVDGKLESREGLSTRDFFHAGFGGRAVVLPPAMIWFPSRAFRMAYRAALRSGGMKLFKSMAGFVPRLRSRRAAVHGVR